MDWEAWGDLVWLFKSFCRLATDLSSLLCLPLETWRLFFRANLLTYLRGPRAPSRLFFCRRWFTGCYLVHADCLLALEHRDLFHWRTLDRIRTSLDEFLFGLWLVWASCRSFSLLYGKTRNSSPRALCRAWREEGPSSRSRGGCPHRATCRS